jgi:rhodanese-related sulfurtransferase/DNA-binding transcriptional ArsR family regulator
MMSTSTGPPGRWSSRVLNIWSAGEDSSASLSFVEQAGRRQAKDELFDAFASVARALGNGRRAEIVDLLAQGEQSVEQVAREIGQSVANTSHHLRGLAAVGLLRSRRDGQRIFYRLVSERVAELWGALRDVAVAHIADVDVLANGYLGDRAGIDQVTADELADRLRSGRVVVLDVRPASEYAAGHIAGARSAPIDDLDTAVEELPRSREVIAYCRGPYCVYADDAVRLLHERGFRARRLDSGYPEWQRAGLPTDRSPKEQTA